MSVAEYAKQKNLLHLKAFKWCGQFLGEHQAHINFIKASMPANVGKLKWVFKELQGLKQWYQFGYEIPKSIAYTYELDAKNRNTKWGDAMQAELDALQELNVFWPLPRASGGAKIMAIFLYGKLFEDGWASRDVFLQQTNWKWLKNPDFVLDIVKDPKGSIRFLHVLWHLICVCSFPNIDIYLSEIYTSVCCGT